MKAAHARELARRWEASKKTIVYALRLCISDSGAWWMWWRPADFRDEDGDEGFPIAIDFSDYRFPTSIEPDEPEPRA
jgi:hypothetical protein